MSSAPGDLPNPGIKPRSLALQADSLPSEPPRKQNFVRGNTFFISRSTHLCSITHSLTHCTLLSSFQHVPLGFFDSQKKVNWYESCTNKRQETHFLKIPGPNKIQTQHVNSKYKVVGFQTLFSWLRSADFTLVRRGPIVLFSQSFRKIKNQLFLSSSITPTILTYLFQPFSGHSVMCNWLRPAFKP